MACNFKIGKAFPKQMHHGGSSAQKRLPHIHGAKLLRPEQCRLGVKLSLSAMRFRIQDAMEEVKSAQPYLKYPYAMKQQPSGLGAAAIRLAATTKKHDGEKP
jgi:hypothetical protein